VIRKKDFPCKKNPEFTFVSATGSAYSILIIILYPKHIIIAMNHVILIDQFIVPAQSRKPFIERMQTNRNFIKLQPGFINDQVFEQTTENGELKFITLATWENEEAFTQAKKAVSALYQKQGFNIGEMLGNLQIRMERGIYSHVNI
jgi:heme-degrading monooxygenase HmoA